MEDLEGYHACVASVAAERKHIGKVKAPPLEDSRKWMRSVIEAGYPFFVVTDGQAVVGWCDVGRRDAEGFRHAAELGMGLLPGRVDAVWVLNCSKGRSTRPDDAA